MVRGKEGKARIMPSVQPRKGREGKGRIYQVIERKRR
jgi:hypothetical protein